MASSVNQAPDLNIINIMASSLDGFIGTRPLESDSDRLDIGFLSSADHLQVEKQLALADAVILGGESMRVSAGIWRVEKKNPLWLVMTNQGIPMDHAFWKSTDIQRWIASSNRALEDQCSQQGVGFLFLSENEAANHVRHVCRKLASLQCKQIILFGGGKVNKLFYEANLVNELQLTICPFIVGNSTAPRFVDPNLGHPKKFSLVSFESVKNHVILKYRSHHE